MFKVESISLNLEIVDYFVNEISKYENIDEVDNIEFQYDDKELSVVLTGKLSREYDYLPFGIYAEDGYVLKSQNLYDCDMIAALEEGDVDIKNSDEIIEKIIKRIEK